MSNLPYNVAVPVVVRLLEDAPAVDRILVMVQREVGERLAAGPGDEQYGAVSVKVAYYAEAALVGSSRRRCSCRARRSIRCWCRCAAGGAAGVGAVGVGAFTLVRAGFAQRRKMLRRALAPVLGDRAAAVLAGAGVEPTARAESSASNSGPRSPGAQPPR